MLRQPISASTEADHLRNLLRGATSSSVAPAGSGNCTEVGRLGQAVLAAMAELDVATSDAAGLLLGPLLQELHALLDLVTGVRNQNSPSATRIQDAVGGALSAGGSVQLPWIIPIAAVS